MGMAWINLVRQWRNLVTIAKNLRIPQTAVNFLPR